MPKAEPKATKVAAKSKAPAAKKVAKKAVKTVARKPAAAAKTPPPLPTTKQIPLGFADLNDEQREYIATVTKVRKRMKNQWRGMASVPPGSLLATILAAFESSTEIPLEMPMFTFFHYLSTHLIDRGVKLKIKSSDITMEFWTVILASSGAGKTFVNKTLRNGLGADISQVDGTGTVSAASFLEELAAANGKGLWTRDEFLQFLNDMNSGGPQAQMKDYLLRIYDGEPINRITKKDRIEVPEPVLSILAFNALQPFVEGVDPISMLDGFAQRFGYVIAKDDPKRSMQDFALWDIDSTTWGAEWQKLIRDIQPVYSASDEGIEAFRRSFKELIHEELPASFYRRILWKAHKYAVLYHVLRGEGANPVIGMEDYGWAARVLAMHISDAAEILAQSEFGDLEKLIQQCERAVIKLNSAGIPVTHRSLLQRVKGLKNAATAKFVFDHMKLDRM